MQELGTIIIFNQEVIEIIIMEGWIGRKGGRGVKAVIDASYWGE